MRVNHLEKNQEKIFINALKYPHNAIWIIGRTNGIRISDVLNIPSEKMNKKQFTIKEIKTGKSKRIYIPIKAKMLYDKYCKDKKTEKAFNISRQAVHKAFKRASKKAGIKGNISTHSMRKTYAWKLYENKKKQFNYIKNKLNHENLADTLRYLI